MSPLILASNYLSGLASDKANMMLGSRHMAPLESRQVAFLLRLENINQINLLRTQGKILELPVGGTKYYPAWQFVVIGSEALVHPGCVAVFNITKNEPVWEVAEFMTTPRLEFEDYSPEQIIHSQSVASPLYQKIPAIARRLFGIY